MRDKTLKIPSRGRSLAQAELVRDLLFMASDPAFLFYPGDYLRDTQCLSEAVQVAYDRIICEHMRNICISQQQLNFFTKRLNDDQKKELLSVLKKVNGGYQIQWVAESIEKRRNYSDSRRKNREGKQKHMPNISKSYVPHMENENVIENVIDIEDELKRAFDEIYLSNQRINWSHIDFEFQYRTFCDKVRGSPEHYQNHDTGGLRLAFQKQLREAKPKSNGQQQKKLHDLTNL